MSDNLKLYYELNNIVITMNETSPFYDKFLDFMDEVWNSLSDEEKGFLQG